MPTETQLDSRATGISERCHPVPGSDNVLRIITVTGAAPGPVLGVIGAIHGDELEGPLAIRQILSNIDPTEFAGTLILLPVANPDAITTGQRCSPIDHMNLARVFPGNLCGSPTEAMAAIILREVIDRVDALIDLHSAAVSTESPLFAGYIDSPGELGQRAAAMAVAFGAPVVCRHGAPCPPGRTLSEAELRNVPAIYVEATGGLTPSEEAIDTYAEGVLRVMQQLGMFRPILPAAKAPLRLYGNADTDAPCLAAPLSGLLDCRIQLDRPVAAGQTCFLIHDIDGALLAKVTAQTSGWPLFLRRSRWVERGGLLLTLAETDPAANPAELVVSSRLATAGAAH